MAEPLEPAIATWLLSAGGGNVDILAAFKSLVAREPRQLGVLCGRAGSPLTELAQAHAYVDLLLFDPPAGKDGFLATNSLVAFIALLTRAYLAEFDQHGATWAATAEELRPFLDEKSETVARWQEATAPLWSRPTTLVLHGASSRIGAIDLESKFTEAALGNLQLADYRNFAHGRHHWLAKRGSETAILAFLTDEDRTLAERTLALVPSDIPLARIDLPGPSPAAALGSLVGALRITGWAGEARGIDPGRPGVPLFGRKLYNLPLGRQGTGRVANLSDTAAAAITRKSGLSISVLSGDHQLEYWQPALKRFEARLRKAQFAGVVLDYDGTLVDARRRFFTPIPEIVAELSRLSEAGAQIAIATGRGGSVRRDLQAVLPERLWPNFLVGYYNGAEIAALDVDDAPDATSSVCEALVPLAAALRAQPELALSADQTDRPYQITLEARRPLPENRLWDLAKQVIIMTGDQGARVTRSSHSVDIVAPGVSKRSVLDRLRAVSGPGPYLTIGDRGRWPGNDYELLHEAHALSVDEVSLNPETCWNLAPPGQRGIEVTLDYLRRLTPIDGRLRFDFKGPR
ncbi:HAD hydrolase family protein [Caulobacter sp. LARHSG274]